MAAIFNLDFIFFPVLQKCKTHTDKCKSAGWKGRDGLWYHKYAYKRQGFTYGRNIIMSDKKQKRMNRAAGWIMLVLLILVIIPIGAVMFVISGLWSAADRALLRFSR